MDEYYMLQFFKFVDDNSGDRPLPTFQYPAHFDTLDDAKAFAEFWMSFGFFDACRCDKHIDPILQFSGELKAGVFVLDKKETGEWQ